MSGLGDSHPPDERSGHGRRSSPPTRAVPDSTGGEPCGQVSVGFYMTGGTSRWPRGVTLSFAALLWAATLLGRQTRLTFGGPAEASTSPSWSPDDSRIAFARDNDIYVMGADGSGQIRAFLPLPQSCSRVPPWKSRYAPPSRREHSS